MAPDEPSDEGVEDSAADTPTDGDKQGANATDSEGSRADAEPEHRIEDGRSRAVEEFDERIVDLLSWLLETETRARIYVYLQQHPHSTSDEITDGTGLYPSTVREALAELADDGTVERRKRSTDGAGNNPYEYTAIPPSELVGNVAGQIQSELNTVFTLDESLSTDESEDADDDEGPVTITIGTPEESTDTQEATADTESVKDDAADEQKGDEHTGDETTDDEEPSA